MFDINADDGSVRRKTFPVPDVTLDPEPKRRRGDPMDSNAAIELHKRLLDHYTREIERQKLNRAEQAEEADFYDNIQWTEDDAQVLRDRGQLPLVYNVMSATIDWVCGTQKRARTDFQILPRRAEDSKPAEKKTQLLKYLGDVNHSHYGESEAFEDAVKVGVGWMEDGIQEEGEEEPIYAKYESWRNILHDSASTQPDLSDCRYIFRVKWIDMDIACAMFPNRKGLIERSSRADDDFRMLDQYGDEVMDYQETEVIQNSQNYHQADPFGYVRQRLRIIEMWYRRPVRSHKISGGPFNGEFFDPFSIAHRESIASGEAELIEKKAAMRMHVALFTPKGMLWHGKSPYRHNRFPFSPIWGYRRDRDNLPYGMVRRLKDLQQDVNKRASKALHILSTNKTIMDRGALADDMSIEDYLEEIANPDAVIVVEPGKKIDINADRDLADAHLHMMGRTINLIQSASGVTDENMGRKTNATSGIAIQRRQDQGALASMKFFENLHRARQMRGEKQLSMVEQFMDREKQFRITRMAANKAVPEYVTINDGLPENDVIRTKADFLIAENEFHATMREAAVQQLLEAMQTLPPQVSMVMLDLVLENTDLPNREEIVQRVRQITGMSDPNAEEPTPQEIQAQQQAEQERQLSQAAIIADLKKKAADAAKAAAQAEEILAKIAKTNVDSAASAVTVADQVLANPATADMADAILEEAGFVSASDKQAAAGINGNGAAGLPRLPAPTNPATTIQ